MFKIQNKAGVVLFIMKKEKICYREHRRTRRLCCHLSLGQCSASSTLKCSGETDSLYKHIKQNRK